MSGFETTQWSLVVRTRGEPCEARAALETLCRIYRPPVLAYIRSRGVGSDVAEDLTQTFFTRFIERESYADADPERGRFRALLLTAVKRFLINAADEAHALKRGGGQRLESLDQDDGANGVASGGETPDRVFERAWAFTVLDRALQRLCDEAAHAGKGALFDRLRDFLTEPPDATDYARIAAALNLRPNTLAVAVHRLRQRLRELVREEIADTTSDRGGLASELRELRGALGTVMQAEARVGV